MGSGFLKKKRDQRQFSEQLARLGEELKSKEYVGYAPNQLVEIVLTGEKSLKKILIKKDCVNPDDIEGLQDLIKAAYEDAEKKMEGDNPLNSVQGMPFGF
ncbi:MAG: YbaB/EbfC family nucleoid-associated protein [Verrucomicrobia bacterium]|nr:YbaB/EbfC family nucleoid-associated protein [Verrucomicrobiota bacterium]NDE62794.1 YbaB/EbfC family nucleoid-associated protein [Chlamydiota bacterium]